MADNFGRNIYKFTIDPPVSGLSRSFDVLVDAVNRRSANLTVQSFFARYNKFEVKMVDAPEYCISIPELGILHDPASHLTVGAQA